RSLVKRPNFFQRLHIEGCQFAEIAVAAGTLVERPVGAASIAVAIEVWSSRDHHLACLNERRDQHACRSVVAGCGPVVAARAGGTSVYRFTERLFDDVFTISRLSGFRIELRPDVLKNRLGVA